MGRFAPHGTFELSFEDHIIHLKVVGQTNLEQLEMIGEEILRQVQPLAGRPFALLMEFGDEAFLTAEAVAKSQELVVRDIELGLCASGIVVGAIEFRELTVGLVTSFYEKLGLSWGIFDTVADAQEWLKSEIDRL
ncbi:MULTISPECIES: hypothetical protein [Alphaproteobacteria]|uniref:hypothetical protein n=1 Tax=Alphaproteobacteria TaxID=28211 RepID=UPI003264B675